MSQDDCKHKWGRWIILSARKERRECLRGCGRAQDGVRTTKR
jgi:hypothetical protein